MNRRMFAVLFILTFLIPARSAVAAEVTPARTNSPCNLQVRQNKGAERLQASKCNMIQICTYQVPELTDLGLVMKVQNCIPLYCIATYSHLKAIQISDCSPSVGPLNILIGALQSSVAAGVPAPPTSDPPLPLPTPNGVVTVVGYQILNVNCPQATKNQSIKLLLPVKYLGIKALLNKVELKGGTTSVLSQYGIATLTLTTKFLNSPKTRVVLNFSGPTTAPPKVTGNTPPLPKINFYPIISLG